MRRVILSVLSISVAALLMAQPTVAAKSTVYVTDRVDDMCHFLWFPWQAVNFPLEDYDYLDATASWMTLKDEKLTAGIEVVGPIFAEDGLPQGVKRIWYTWYFNVAVEPEVHFYGLHVSWDGDTFYAFIADGDPATPHQYNVITYLQNFRVQDNVVEVDLDAGLLSAATGWFFEVVIWMIVPEDDYYMDPAKWYWYCIDLTDGDLAYLPWQPMPS